MLAERRHITYYIKNAGQNFERTLDRMVIQGGSEAHPRFCTPFVTFFFYIVLNGFSTLRRVAGSFEKLRISRYLKMFICYGQGGAIEYNFTVTEKLQVPCTFER